MDERIKKAISLRKERKAAEALAILEEVLAGAGPSSFLLNNIGLCRAALGEYQAAEDLYQEALRLDPDDIYIHCNLAEIRKKQGRFKEAAGLYEEAIGRQPDNAYCLCQAALCHQKLGDEARALELVQKALEQKPPTVKVLNMAGSIFKAAGRPEEAKNCYRQALEINPEDSFTTRQLFKLGQEKKAPTQLSEELALLRQIPSKAGNPYFSEIAGDLHKARGEVHEAVAEYEAALEKDKDSIYFLKKLAYAVVKTGELDRAYQLLQEALLKCPADFYLNQSFLSVAGKLHREDEAYEFYQRLLRRHPEERRIYGWLHRLAKKSGGQATKKTVSAEGTGDPLFAFNLEQKLKLYFGFSSFREGQEEIIRTVLDGRDTLAIMPTGGGKSLCYELPAMLFQGLVLVFCPLISLMKDQVDGLLSRGIKAAFINSTLSPEEQEKNLKEAASGTLRLLYAAPERLRSAVFKSYMKKLMLSLCVIDEAHCISQWGHNFRPDYLRLGRFIEEIGRPPVLALTATATVEVRQDILHYLKIPQARVFLKGFERPELFFSVLHTGGAEEKFLKLKELLSETGGGPGIIYCSTRKNVEELSRKLPVPDSTVIMYHAGLSEKERSEAQELFISEKKPVVIATNAFGMGIDRPDVRWVVHYNMPGTPEAYYQEAGRAGRDGHPAQCAILFSEADIKTQQYFIDGSNPQEELVRELYGILLKQNREVVELTQSELAGLLSGNKNEAAVGAALKLLEECRVLERGPEYEPYALLELFPQLGGYIRELSPNAKNLKLTGEYLLSNFAASGEKAFSVPLSGLARELSVNLEVIKKALSELDKKGVLAYRAPSRARGLKIKRRLLPQELPLDSAGLKEKREKAIKKLQVMLDYCRTEACRKKFILDYFQGEKTDYKCGNCDFCSPSGNLKTRNLKVAATRDQGSRNGLQPALSLMDKNLKVSLNACQGQATTENQFVPPGTPAGLVVARPPGVLNLIQTVAKDTSTFSARLREWRDKRAAQKSIESSKLLSETGLKLIAARRPETEDRLLSLSGISPAFVEEFGAEILELVRSVK